MEPLGGCRHTGGSATNYGSNQSGELAPGARVPSERELAAGRGKIRMTARPAVGLLARRGLVERRESRGCSWRGPRSNSP